MPRSSPIQNTFNGGEISPRMEGRSDLDRYSSSVSKMENFLALSGGSARRRPGSRFIEPIKDSTTSKLIPFKSTAGIRYMLELGEGFIRVFKDQVLIDHPDLTFEPADVDFGATELLATHEIHIPDKSYWEGQIVRFTTAGTLPAGLAIDTDYYVRLAQPITFGQADVNTGTNDFGGPGTAFEAHELYEGMGPYTLSFVPTDLTAITGHLPNFQDNAGVNEVCETSTLWYINRIDADTIRLRPDTATALPVTISLNGVSTNVGNFVLTPTLQYQRDKFRLSATPSSVPLLLTTAGVDTHTASPSTSASDQTNPPLEIDSPFLLADFAKFDWARTEKATYFVTPNVQPQVLTSAGDTKWRLDSLLMLDGPWRGIQEDDQKKDLVPTTFTPSGDGAAPYAIRNPQGRLVTSIPTFTLANIGQLVRMDTEDPADDSPVDWGWAEIVGLTDASTALIEIKGTIDENRATEKWHLGLFQPHIAGVWPDVIGFFEQRLAFTGGITKPSNIYTSRTADFNNFSPTDVDGLVPDDSALNFHIVSNEPNTIQWISTVRVPVIGTSDGIYVLEATSLTQAITPTNLSARLQSAFGASRIRPVRVDDALLYVGRTQESVRMLAFNFEQDAFAATDVGIFADHLVHERDQGKITQMVYAQEPDSVIWLRQEAGQMIGLTLRREQSVIGWHSHTLGGTGATNKILEMSVLQEDAYDQLWMVHQQFNTALRTNITVFTDHHVDGLDLPDRWGATPDITSTFFLDVATYFGAVNPVPDLDHIEGQLATAIYEVSTGGLRIEVGLTVSGGSVTLTETPVKGVVGLPYASRLESLPIQSGRGGLRSGSDRGLLAHIDRLIVSLDRVIGGQVGDSASNLKDLPHPIAQTDSHPLFFSGEHHVPFGGDWTRQMRLCVHQGQPYPMTVRWWAPQYRQSER